MKTKILGLLTVGLLAGPLAANATLVGDEVGCAITPALWICTPATAIVDAGQEFELDIPAASDRFGLGVDIEANSVRISNIEDNLFGLGAGELLTLSDLDFSPGGTILGIGNLVVSGVSPFDATRISFTGDSVTIDIDSRSTWDVGSFVSFDFITSVPEPGTLALLGLGLAGLGLSRRRRAN